MTTTTLPAAQSTAQARSRAAYRNIALWTLQGWIAMFFIAAGYAKLTEPMSNLIALMGWPAVAPVNMVRGLGAVAGVIDPRLTLSRRGQKAFVLIETQGARRGAELAAQLADGVGAVVVGCGHAPTIT